jgi:hypothetical protein
MIHVHECTDPDARIRTDPDARIQMHGPRCTDPDAQIHRSRCTDPDAQIQMHGPRCTDPFLVAFTRSARAFLPLLARCFPCVPLLATWCPPPGSIPQSISVLAQLDPSVHLSPCPIQIPQSNSVLAQLRSPSPTQILQPRSSSPIEIPQSNSVLAQFRSLSPTQSLPNSDPPAQL